MKKFVLLHHGYEEPTQEVMGADAMTGYSIINAEDMDEAEAIAQGCPIVASIRVYEAMSM